MSRCRPDDNNSTHAHTAGGCGSALPLRDVEHVLWVGPVQNSSVDGPQATKDPEEGALAAAVGAGDQHVHPLIHLKGAAATAGLVLVTPGQ